MNDQSQLAKKKPNKSQPRKHRRLELFAVVAFVGVNLIAPAVVGEMYPFTISPMFRDQPNQYCTYQLFDESGNEVDLEDFGLHLVYDGNPPGLGMGIEPAPLMHDFGEVPELEEVIAHLRKTAVAADCDFDSVRVVQSVVECDGIRPEANVREATVTLRRSERTTK